MSATAEQPLVEAPVLSLGGAASPAGEPAPLAHVQDAVLADGPARAQPAALRVLTGPLEGVEAPLPVGEDVTIGRGFRNDVVLRDKSVGETRLGVELRGEVAKITVLSGEAILLGQRLQAPTSAVLPCYLPVAVGGSALAIGAAKIDGEEADGAADARWRACASLVPDLTVAPSAQRAARTSGHGISWIKDIAVGACAFGAMAAAMMVLTPNEDLAPAVPPAEIVREALVGDRYGEVIVSTRADGDSVLVQGFVATDAEKTALREALAGLGVATTGEVRSGEAAAAQVADVFNSSGVPAPARYIGNGVVLIEGVQADEESASRIRDRALSDVPYLADIRVTRVDPPRSHPSMAFTAEIVSAHGGEDGYLVTRDGGRYFVGGTTPQGGKITQIADGSVTIEDAPGDAMTYTF